MIYKVSYIIEMEDSPGIICERTVYPRIGEQVMIADKAFVVQEVAELSGSRTSVLYLLVKVEAAVDVSP